MELINATRMVAGYTMGMEPSGRELLVVVIKGTFALPKPGEPVGLADEQQPLIMADTFSGEPGFSAPLLETDFAPRKHACDVLLTGHAHAHVGRQVARLRVGLRVGPMQKVFDVVGDRVWQAGPKGIIASLPQPFTEMPVSYDRAFGGADRYSEDESEHDAYLPNPVGRGWHRHLKSAWVDGTPLPNTEEVDRPVLQPSDACHPMALGPLGRGWTQRACYAGTYDQAWLDHECPFLPHDFDDRYFQAAPLDQRIPIPQGPIPVELSHLSADGDCRFVLPAMNAAVHVFPRQGRAERHFAQLDTIVIEPDRGHCTLTWRYTRPLVNDMFEIAQVLVGNQNKTWWLAREEGQMPGSESAVESEQA